MGVSGMERALTSWLQGQLGASPLWVLMSVGKKEGSGIHGLEESLTLSLAPLGGWAGGCLREVGPEGRA